MLWFSAARHSISVCVQQVLARCRENQSSWEKLNATDTRNRHHRPLVSSCVTHSRVFPCILSALQWISQRTELESAPAGPFILSKVPPQSTGVPDRLREAAHVSVLVTGSLYLVGGVLKHLEPSLDS